MKQLFLLCVVMSFGMFGCGSSGGGSAELKTSFVTASAKTAVLDSDIVKWTNASACTGGSIPAADSVDVDVVSKPYSNTGSMGLPIRIESATVSYTPANSATPAMASEYQIVGVTVTNGGSATVPVRVVTQEQKMKLQNNLACNSAMYNYYTKITLSILEIGTDTKSTVETSMQLRLADFVDK